MIFCSAILNLHRPAACFLQVTGRRFFGADEVTYTQQRQSKIRCVFYFVAVAYKGSSLKPKRKKYEYNSSNLRAN